MARIQSIARELSYDGPSIPSPMLRQQYQAPAVCETIAFEGEHVRWARKVEKCPSRSELRRMALRADELGIDWTHVLLRLDFINTLGLTPVRFSIHGDFYVGRIPRELLYKSLHISLHKSTPIVANVRVTHYE